MLQAICNCRRRIERWSHTLPVQWGRHGPVMASGGQWWPVVQRAATADPRQADVIQRQSNLPSIGTGFAVPIEGAMI